MKHQIGGILALLVALSSAAAFAGDTGAIRVQRCVSLWQLTVEVEQRSPYRVELCRGGIEPTPWLQTESDDKNAAPLWVRPEWQEQRVVLSIAESDGGDVLWSAAVNPPNKDWQSLERVGHGDIARLQLSPLPMPAGGIVQIDAVNAPSDQVLSALMRASDLKVNVSEPAKGRITLQFHAMSAATVVTLIADANDLWQTWDASGAITLRRPRDGARVAALVQGIDAGRQAETDGDAGAAAHSERLYAELHALIKLRGPKDLPPDASDALSGLAVRLRNGSNPAELVALRRSMLALAQVYDARKDSPGVARAQANLAYALQHAGAPGDEDLALLRAAEPVLVQSSPNTYDREIAEQASALTRRGFARSALTLLERGFRPCTPDDALVWLLDSESLSWALLEHYRETRNSEQAARVLEQWQRCIIGQTTVTQAVRIGETRRSLVAGRFVEAAAACDLIVLRLPPLATLESSELNELLEDALLAHLASGHYARAAEILSLATRLIAARSGPDPKRSDERTQAQAFVDALASAVPQPTSVWDQRYRSIEPLARGGQARDITGRNWPNLEQTATMIVLSPLLEQLKGADLIALHERTAILGFATLPESLAPAEANRHITKALELRVQAGASPAQQQTHRLELEELVTIAKQAMPKR